MLIPPLIQRINETPYPETSEDLRLKIMGIFIKLTQYKECLLKTMPELASAISKCLLDGYDQIKIVIVTINIELLQLGELAL